MFQCAVEGNSKPCTSLFNIESIILWEKNYDKKHVVGPGDQGYKYLPQLQCKFD